MCDEFRSLYIAERAEEGHEGKDARDHFGVHGGDDTRACVCNPNKSDTSRRPPPKVLIATVRASRFCDVACSLA